MGCSLPSLAGRFEEKDTIRIVEVEELSDMSEVEEEDDFLRTGRFARWERVSISAGKQSLRQAVMLHPKLSPWPAPNCLMQSSQ